MSSKFSFEGRAAALVVTLIALAVAASAIAVLFLGAAFGSVVAFGVFVPIAIYAVHRFTRPVNRLVRALRDGVASFRDGDFSLNLADSRGDELGELVRAYNEASAVLRGERQNLYQRELLLESVIQSMPWAIVLENPGGRIVYSNVAARRLFNEGRKLEGHQFAHLLARAPEGLREAVESGREGMFAIRQPGEDETYYITREVFTLNAQAHEMYLFKLLTRELNRQEVAIWKKVIRVISHELNNSLAPISSLAHSGRVVAKGADPARAGELFAAIEERADHLKSFIDGYASFAKLPAPRYASVAWPEFVESLRQVEPFALAGELPAEPGHFDGTQLQQVLINLLKNARESGSAPEAIRLSIHDGPMGTWLDVTDAGPGMTPEVLEQALLPFYSTKQTGTGLGLSLSREIIESHGGRISLANRPEGGLHIRVWLPRIQGDS